MAQFHLSVGCFSLCEVQTGREEPGSSLSLGVIPFVRSSPGLGSMGGGMLHPDLRITVGSGAR